MKLPDKRIIEFINKHHILNLSTVFNNLSYCCTVFYAYSEIENCFIFTSNSETMHVKNFLANSNVSGTIALETKMVGLIKGLQFLGNVIKMDETELKHAKNIYLKAFPIALLMDIQLWKLTPTYYKFTDNKLGFGKKLIWKLEENEV